MGKETAHFRDLDPDFLAHAVYLGIDQSLTRTGLCFEDDKRRVLPCVLVPPEKVVGLARLVWLRQSFAQVFRSAPSLRAAAMEGYSFGSKFNREKLGELGALVRLALYDAGQLPTVIATPTQLKKFLTGDGSGGKGNIIKEVYKVLGVDVNDDNEADAVVLCQIAGAWFTRAPTLKYRREMLDKVDVLQPKKRPLPSPRARVRTSFLTPGAKIR